MNHKFEHNLTLGIGVAPISEQLKIDGLECDHVEQFQEIADAISTLQKHDYIYNHVADQLREKLFRKMYPRIRVKP